MKATASPKKCPDDTSTSRPQGAEVTAVAKDFEKPNGDLLLAGRKVALYRRYLRHP